MSKAELDQFLTPVVVNGAGGLLGSTSSAPG